MSQSLLFDMIQNIPPFISNLWRGGQNGSPTKPQDQPASPSEPSKGEEEVGATAVRFEEVKELQREVEEWKGRVGRREAEMAGWRAEGEKLKRACKSREDRILELESEIGKLHGFYGEDTRRRTQHLQATEERLKHTEELLASRSAELNGAQSFLSTTGRLSEAEVLSIVRDLNENIYRVAVNLTQEWEKSQYSQAMNSTDVDLTSLACIPPLIQLVRNRDSMGMTFQFQSSLCFSVANITSRWAHHPELAILRTIYQGLSASGKHHQISQLDIA